MTHTWPAPGEAPADWLRGRSRYGVWVVDADTTVVRDRLAAVRAHLGEWLWPTERQPHVTVWVGGFLGPIALYDDDLPAGVLARQRQRLAAARWAPFDLWIGGLATFESAAYLAVDDPAGALQALRRLLGAGRGEFRDSTYRPHVTVGLYRGRWPLADVRRRMAAFDAGAPLRLVVRDVRFVSYEAARLDGPLRDEPAACATRG